MFLNSAQYFIYPGGGVGVGGDLMNVDGVYICDQQWIPLQGVA